MTERRLVKACLAGERAGLRPHVPGDAPEAFAMLADNEPILRWLVWAGPGSVEELASYYRGWRGGDGGPGSHYRFAIEELSSGRLAGSISIALALAGGTGDVGYWVGTEFQGRGLGREALLLTTHLAFRHLGAAALEARVFTGNGASRRILERCGFTLERTVLARRRPAEAPIDQWRFVLLASEWRRLVAVPALSREEIEWEPLPDPLAGDEAF
jgi:ribosomal-protein-serine acetyltransferase